VDWGKLAPGKWLTIGVEEFETFPAVATKEGRAAELEPQTIFKTYSLGVSTNRDEVVYGFSRGELADRVREFCENYNAEVDRYKRSGKELQGQAFDRFLNYSKVKWSRDLKKDLRRGRYAEFIEAQIRTAAYRPFTKRYLYLADLLNDTPGLCRAFFPTDAAGIDNRMLVTSDLAYRSPSINVLAANHPADLHLCASVDGHQCFPFYVYESDGKTRHENITEWALEHFRKHHADKKITKWDIFYYVYGVLHHPEYRAKYAENLKRELPRIPLVKDFRGFSKAGEQLAGLHVDYEKLEPYQLKFMETGSSVAAISYRHGGVKPPLHKAAMKGGATIPLSYRVEDKMRLAKDHRSLKVNDSLTLGGIPPETFEYRLGNRSALEWVIGQYQVTEGKHSGIRSDPNRADDPEYIVRLVGQVIRLSLETVKAVKSLPAL
jgi:predicted helicase